jgi:hypothetical protein
MSNESYPQSVFKGNPPTSSSVLLPYEPPGYHNTFGRRGSVGSVTDFLAKNVPTIGSCQEYAAQAQNTLDVSAHLREFILLRLLSSPQEEQLTTSFTGNTSLLIPNPFCRFCPNDGFA